MWTGEDCSATKVTNYGFNIPAFIKCRELQTVLCIFHKLHYSTGSLNIASAKRDFCDKINISIGYGLEDNLQIVQDYWQLDVSGFTCQPLGFGRTEQHRAGPAD